MTEISETLQSYEELFAQRFSSEDQEYQQYVKRPTDPPPVVEDWRGRGGNQRGRDNRYQDRRGPGDRGWGGGRGWGGDRGWRRDHHGHDRDRQWGHGSEYRSGTQSSNQGYNSHHQRPRYDCY
ncbi:RNA guanine-N7 methyltransferase-activating subunit-like protein [Cololabis saira]|uniref:RNA guanine-N7 methyltransferase-activating subunit-like protein n=1 Tax=Cololabis saira TaxID=129043 RepID=UPI002AD2CDC4|nr:RNA guanine-N7 methyltransferase-activating subunit-like protein [Cololabis saira]